MYTRTPGNWKYQQGLVEMFRIKFKQNLLNTEKTVYTLWL